jgi:hypothetical protein
MKLKPKPQKPERKKISKKLRLFDGDSAEGITNFIKEYEAAPADCFIDVEYGYGDGSDAYYLSVQIDEPEEDYQKRYEKYRKSLKEWYQWYNENKEEIKLQREKEKKIKELQKEYRERMIKIQKMEMKDLS